VQLIVLARSYLSAIVRFFAEVIYSALGGADLQLPLFGVVAGATGPIGANAISGSVCLTSAPALKLSSRFQ
jgi:hypothetical protein